MTLITDELVERVAREMWARREATLPVFTRIAFEGRLNDLILEDARAALAVMVPEIVESCAKKFGQTVPAEFEIEEAMNGDFDARALALAVRLICGKIVWQKIESIRSLAG